MHMMSMRDHIHEEKRNSSGINRILYDYYSEGLITTTEEATVHVKDLDMFITVQLFGRFDSPAVISVHKSSEEHGYSYAWKGQSLT